MQRQTQGKIWWFFRSVHGYTLKEQADAARQLVPDERCWLGHMEGARRFSCRDILRLVHNADEPVSASRPIRQGDTLWVHNTFCLGLTTPRVNEALTKLHEAGIRLRIYSIGYDDKEGRNDFEFLHQFLSEWEIKSKKYTEDKMARAFSEQKNRRGRRPLNITYASLTDKGKKLIRQYCLNPDITPDEFYAQFNNSACLGKDSSGKDIESISWSKLRPLIRSVDQMLKKKGYETYRSRKLRKPASSAEEDKKAP